MPPTRTLKDFLHETNGNGNPKTVSFKAIHAVVIAAVKRISFPSMKSRTILPRSLSRRLLGKRERDERQIGGDFVVKVKDIIRWRSFRDLVDETAEMAAPPFDFADSPDRHTLAATTSTTTTTTTATTSNSSSWCESDFSAEDLLSPSWGGSSDDHGHGDTGKIYFPCVGEDSTETTAGHEENDKQVNTLSKGDDDKEEDEEKVLEKRARQVEEHVEEATSHWHLDWQLLELFQREEKRVKNNDKVSSTKVEEDENGCEWFLSQEGKEAYLIEMERKGKWGVFGVEEKVELGLEIEGQVLGCLVDEILLDVFQS